MFLGHIALGLAAKPAAPRTSAGLLVGASLLIDLVWPLLLLAGVERVRIEPGLTAVNPLRFTHYPWTHSLLLVLVWGALLATSYYLLRRAPRAALVLGALVVSHWVLDWITHVPDLPLWPGEGAPLAGLGAWNSLPLTLVLEFGLLAAGVWLYTRSTPGGSARARASFWSFIAVVVVIYLATLLGPPPPTPRAIAWSALALWLLPLWVHAFDRARTRWAREQRLVQ